MPGACKEKGSPGGKTPAETPLGVEIQFNLAYKAKVDAALKTMHSHTVFKDLFKNAKALGHKDEDKFLNRCGFKAAFDAKVVKGALQSSGTAEFGGNFFWQSTLDSPVPNVPIRTKAVEKLRDRDFAEPVEFPDKLRAAVDNADADVAETQGTWVHVTPDELIHAYVLAIARDIVRADKPDLWKYKLMFTCNILRSASNSISSSIYDSLFDLSFLFLFSFIFVCCTAYAWLST